MHTPTEQQSTHDDAKAISTAASVGLALIKPLAEALHDQSLAQTPAFRRQIAGQIAIHALGMLQKGVLKEVEEPCRLALLHDPSGEYAQACELAVLRRQKRRSYADDRRDMESGARDPFIIGLSYFAEKHYAYAHKNELLSTAAEHLAGFFFWYAVKRNPGKAAPLTNLAASLIDLGAGIAAEDVLKRALNSDASDPHALHYLGRIYHSWGMFAEALKWLERSVRAGHTDDEPVVGAIKKALSEAGEKVTLARSATERGMILWIMGKYQEAFDSLMEDAPTLTEQNPLAVAGHCQRMLGLCFDAVSFFRLAEGKGWSAGAAFAIQCMRDAGSRNGALTLADEYHTKYGPKLPDVAYFAADLYRQDGNMVMESRAVDYLFKWDVIIRAEKNGNP